MRGGAQTHLIETTDGSSYVVKFRNNPQHPRIVINEWIGSAVLRHLGISTPDIALVNISANFIRENPDVYLELASSRASPTCGSHFGSRLAGKSAQTIYDMLPDARLGSVVNLADFCGVLVVDKWLGNTDYRQSVFASVRNIDRTLSFEAQMIDNGQMFDGGNWRFEDSHLRGPYMGRVYQHVRGLDDFEPWLAVVASFSEALLEDAFQQMPSSWRCGDTEGSFGMLLHQLRRRRARVGEFISACHDQPTNPFPNWP